MTTAVDIKGLVKRYGDKTAVDALDLTIEAGTIFGLLGPNGAGKTTTIETLVGLRAPTSGRVRVLGIDPTTDRAALRRVVAVQPQKAALFPNLTVNETLRLWASLHDHPASVDEVVRDVGLADSGDTLVRRLSGGQERRLLVATALVVRPRLLVLDEPSVGLDPNARADLWEAVLRFRDKGGTVLLSTNSMEEAEALCEHVVIIDRGRVLAQGSPTELTARHAPQRVVSYARDAHGVRDLASVPGVSGVDIRGGRVHVRTGEPEAVTAALLSGSTPARDVSVRAPGLDDVFRVLTGRALTGGGE
jgi:ABC-2 type transport system ATP-binding protein